VREPWWSPWRELGTGLVELLLPAACAACGERALVERALCEACEAALPAPPRGASDPPPRPLDGWAAGAAFAGPVEEWIRRFKYPRAGLAGLDPAARGVARALILRAAARAPGSAPELVVPIPLHPRRLRARGFNPAARLARWLARERELVCDARALERLRDTPSQTGLDRRARARNVRGAFRPRPGFRAPREVWLVDDVATTGATLAAAARALRRAGARQIVAICAARTP
jgi:ComF family protein